MKKHRSLAATNRYCKDPAMKKRMLYDSAASSSRVEGIKVPRYTTKKSHSKSKKPSISDRKAS